MKVLHVVHGSYPENTGGAESYVRNVIAEQRAAGIDAVLLSGSIEPWAECGVEELEVDGARVLRVHRDDLFFDVHSKAYHPGVERVVREVLARERPDVLHVHQWIRLTCNLIEIADDLGIPAVVTLHDLYTSCPRAFRVRPGDEACDRPLSVESCLRCVPRYGHEPDAEIAEGIELHHAYYRSELSRARSVLVASEATADMVSTTTGFARDRFTILPLAYPRKFPGGAPAPAGAPGPGEPLRFAYWGSVTHRKGAHVLLDAFAAVIAGKPSRPVELHVFGRVDTEALHEELKAKGAGLPVHIHGRYEYDQIAAVGPHVAVFAILCFETFGFVLDEAFEMGLPAIVTDIGALPRRAGDAALAVPPNDVPAVAAAMRSLVDDPSKLDALRAAIPALPPEPAAHVAGLRAVYDAAIASPRRDDAPVVDPLRRAAFLLRQRESALRAAHPGAGPQ